MYNIISLVAGTLVSVMVMFNGELATHYGAFTANVITHVVGLCFITCLILVNKDKPFAKKLPKTLYIGGFIGATVTVSQNFAFKDLNVSTILAISLLGQSIAGIIMDHYGLMNMPIVKMNKNKIFGLFLILAGIAIMTNDFKLLPVFLAALSGVNLVISRTINANLSEATNYRIGTFFNYVTGIILSIPVMFLLGKNEPAFTNFSISSNIPMYFAGILGVVIIAAQNICVKKVSSFLLTLIMFIGQVFMGIILDWILSGSFSPLNLYGGVLVTSGLIINTYIDNKVLKNKDVII